MSVDDLLQPILDTAAPLRTEDSPETIPTWDSLAKINIIAAIEDVTGKELSTDEVLSLNSVTAIITVCRTKGLELSIS
jgi:acyl carrier protein